MDFLYIGISLLTLLLGLVVGSILERSHYKSIEKREKLFKNVKVTTLEDPQVEAREVKNAKLVYGSAVISIDYFKRFVAIIKKIFGGNIASYESLVDRAKKEAILRLKEESKGADLIYNLKIETSTIGRNANKEKAIGSVEALAYATAIWLR